MLAYGTAAMYRPSRSLREPSCSGSYRSPPFDLLLSIKYRPSTHPLIHHSDPRVSVPLPFLPAGCTTEQAKTDICLVASVHCAAGESTRVVLENGYDQGESGELRVQQGLAAVGAAGDYIERRAKGVLDHDSARNSPNNHARG